MNSFVSDEWFVRYSSGFVIVMFTVLEARRLLRLSTKKSIGATTGAGGDTVGMLSSRRPIHARHPRAVRAAATPRVPRAQPAGGHGCSLDAWGGRGRWSATQTSERLFFSMSKPNFATKASLYNIFQNLQH